VVPVQENDIVINDSTMRVAPGSRETEKYRTPTKLASFRFRSFIVYRSTDFHNVLHPFLLFAVAICSGFQ
jgi:hypothetical protein